MVFKRETQRSEEHRERGWSLYALGFNFPPRKKHAEAEDISLEKEEINRPEDTKDH